MKNRLLLGASLALGIGYLWLTGYDAGPVRSILKTLPVALLALWVFGRAPVSLVAGLAFGALGDFLLSIEGQAWFLAGMVAFLAGHIAYAATFWRLRRPFGSAAPLWGVALAYIACAVLYLARILPNAGPMAVPVGVYSTVIVLTACLALRAGRGQPFFGAGMTLFVISDGMIAAGMFADHPFGGWIWATYYAAQFLIAIGGLRLSSSLSEAAPGTPA